MIRKNQLNGLLVVVVVLAITIPAFAATITIATALAFADGIADCKMSYQILPTITVACPTHTSLFVV
jgi:hypothetical protein